MRDRQLLCAALLGSSAMCAPAFAQSAPPPPYYNADANGVDPVTGAFNFAITEGSVGSGPGAVNLQRIWTGDAGLVDNWSGGVGTSPAGGTALYVQLGALSDTFSVSGTTYTSLKGDGSTLVSTSLGYTYTAGDGTVVQYSKFSPNHYQLKGFACVNTATGACAIPVSVTKPDGTVFTLNWDYAEKCQGPIGSCLNGGTTIGFYRFKGVSSSAGYSFTLSFKTNSAGSFNQPQPPTDWFIKTGATFANTQSTTGSFPTVSYTYPSSTLTDITDALGRTWQWDIGSTGSGQLEAVKRPGASNNSTVISHNASTGAVTAVVKDGVTTNYSRVVNGTTATTTITGISQPTRVVVADLSLGQITKVTLQAVGQPDRVTQYGHTSGRLTSITYPEGNKTTFAYDGRGNVTTTTTISKTPGTPANIVTLAAFPTTCTNPVTCNKPTSTTDAKGNETDYSYDPTTGQLTGVVEPAPVATQGAAQPTTTYGYTRVGGTSLVNSITTCATATTCAGSANETKTTAAYNSNLLPTSVTRGSGSGSVSATTAYTYDGIGNVLTVDGPLAGTADTTTYRYDADREPVGTISADPDGAGSLVRRAYRLTYNADGQVTKTEAGTVTGTDDSAWAAFVTKQQLTTTYDTNARKVRDVVTAGGTTYGVTDTSYDSAGRLDCTATRMNAAAWGTVTAACTAQAAGSAGPDRITRNGYDPFGELNAVTTAYGQTYASTESTSYTPNGRIAWVIDGENNKTSYSYDGFDRLAKTQYPSPTKGSGTSSATDYEQLGYDPNSNVTERDLRGYASDNNQKILYSYDNLDRLTGKNLPGSEPDVTYGYDLLGRPTSVSQSGNALSFSYDALSRLITETGPQGTLTSTWDAGGRRTKLAWPDGFYVNYDYDVLDEMTAVRENGATSGVGVLASYSYDDLGSRTGATYGNGTTSTWTPDALSRLATLTQNLAGTTYDLTKTFAYNPASQIASSTSSNDAYAWNAAANVNRNYTANGLNQYTASGTTSFGYDTRGNLTTSGTDSYAYSSENLMTAGPGSTSLTYDPLLRLYQVTQSSSTTRFDYDGLEMIAEYNASNALQKRYVFGPGSDEPIVQYTGTGTTSRSWLATDERGSVTALTDSAGNKTAIDSYDEYGIPGTTNNGRFQYTGQAWLPEIGMYYYKARMYSPSLGRFMQTDPIGYGDGLNWYNYVGGDPVNFIDPLGFQDIVVRHCRDGFQSIPDPRRPGGFACQAIPSTFKTPRYVSPSRAFEGGDAPQDKQPICPTPGPSKAPASRRYSDPNWTRPGWQVLYKTFAGYRSLTRSNFGHNNAGDAWRHFRWSFSMAQAMGDTAARDFLEYHERAEPGPAGENQMDANNNAMGLAFASDPKYADLDPDVAANFALKNGCLQTGVK